MGNSFVKAMRNHERDRSEISTAHRVADQAAASPQYIPGKFQLYFKF